MPGWTAKSVSGFIEGICYSFSLKLRLFVQKTNQTTAMAKPIEYSRPGQPCSNIASGASPAHPADVVADPFSCLQMFAQDIF